MVYCINISNTSCQCNDLCGPFQLWDFKILDMHQTIVRSFQHLQIRGEKSHMVKDLTESGLFCPLSRVRWRLTSLSSSMSHSQTKGLIKGGVVLPHRANPQRKNTMLSQSPFIFKDQALASLPIIIIVLVLTFIILSSFLK